MGITGEKTCCACGRNLGLFSGKTKLSDGTYLCNKCEPQAVYTNWKLLDVHYADTMKGEDFPAMVQQREENRKLVENFRQTHKFYDYIHIDADKNQIIILDNATFKNHRKLQEENPTVFSAADLAFWCTEQGRIKDTTIVSSHQSAEAKMYIILGFDSPIYSPIKLDAGKMEAQEGFLFNHIYKDPDLKALTKLLEEMKERAIKERIANGEFAPAADRDSILKMMSKFKARGYIDSKIVKATLDSMFDGSRADIKEAKKKYDL